MISRRYVLVFPAGLTGKPITYGLVKEFDLVVNILRARINPDDIGRLVVELTGEEAMIQKGLDYLREQGVSVEPHSRDIVWNSEECVDCGACTGVCRPMALRLDPHTWKLDFDKGKCVMCGTCVEACPVGAIQVEL
ncbi:MAG: NIL domain-containing protein [Chloroflexota bacterium]